MTRLDAAFAAIVERVIPGATVIGHEALKGGVSASVHALEVSSAAGLTRLVVRHGAAKWKALGDDVTQREFGLLAALHHAGLPVPRPRLLDVSRLVLPAPFFVMDRVEGTTEISDAFLDSALRQMAGFLAHVHALDVEGLRLPVMPRREDPVAGALAYVPVSEEWARLRECLSSYRIESARESLVHGDFWPGNVLWADGRLAAVIDWEDAAIGPAVSDVACCRAELNALFDASAARAFTAYYVDASTDAMRDLALWDVYVGSAALATLHDWGLPAEVEARRRARTSAFVSDATEVLLKAR